MMGEAEEHMAALMQAFAVVLSAEQAVSSVKTALDEAQRQLKLELTDKENELEAAWATVAGLMAETGEVEVVLPDDRNDFLVHWTRPGESVKVEDAEAVPDHLVKLDRKPKLKEIGDALRGMDRAGLPLPNWARLERGEPKLTYKLVKKRVT